MRMTAPEVIDLMRRTAAQIGPAYGIDPEALAQYATGVAWIESRFDPRAHAPKPHTAKGLMQINNITKIDAERWAKQQPAPMEEMYDAEYSALLGMTVLAHRIRRCGSVDLGIIGYNQGNCSAAAQVRARLYLSKWKSAMESFRPTFARPTPGVTLAVKEYY